MTKERLVSGVNVLGHEWERWGCSVQQMIPLSEPVWTYEIEGTTEGFFASVVPVLAMALVRINGADYATQFLTGVIASEDRGFHVLLDDRRHHLYRNREKAEFIGRGRAETRTREHEALQAVRNDS